MITLTIVAIVLACLVIGALVFTVVGIRRRKRD